jgi:hypothetical protein
MSRARGMVVSSRLDAASDVRGRHGAGVGVGVAAIGFAGGTPDSRIGSGSRMGRLHFAPLWQAKHTQKCGGVTIQGEDFIAITSLETHD